MKNRKTFFYLSVLFFAVSIALGFYIPYGVSRIESEWKDYRSEKSGSVRNEINEIIQGKFNDFLDDNKRIKIALRNNISSDSVLYSFETPRNTFIQVWDKDSLLYWNKIIEVDYSDYSEGEIFFFSTELHSYLCIRDTVLSGDEVYYYSIEKLIEKYYKFDNSLFRKVSLTDEISEALGIDVQLIYDASVKPSLSGLLDSFDIQNNLGNKVGTAFYPKASLDMEKKNFVSSVESVQALMFFAAILIFMIGLTEEVRAQKVSYAIYIYILAIAVVRISILILDLPEKLITTKLNDPQYFSSKFAWGLAKTPMDLFITTIAVLLILWLLYKCFIKEESQRVTFGNKYLNYGIVYILFIFILLLFRSFGASVRSFIFDSNLRYFNLSSLLPEFPVIFNLLNLLLVGFAILFLAFIIFVAAYRRLESNKKHTELFAAAVLALITYRMIDDSNLISQVYFALLLISIMLLGFYYINNRSKATTTFIYLSVLTSFFSILFLNKFDQDLTKSSLKIAANEIINGKENLYKFWLHQILTDEKTEKEIITGLKDGENLDHRAFLIWNRSPFMPEDIPVWVGIYDRNMQIVGGYEYLCEGRIPLEIDSLLSEDDYLINDLVKDGNSISEGIKRISLSGSENLYLLFGIEYGALSYSKANEPKFVVPVKYFDKISVDENNYFITKIINNKIVDHIGVIDFSEKQIRQLFSDNIIGKDNWQEINVDGDDFLLYTINGRTLSAVIGLKQKDFSDFLFHFFKILFIHSFLVFIILSITGIIQIGRRKHFVINFRTRLFLSFFIVSLIPIIFLAVYLRDLTETKNHNSIKYKLKKRADRVEKYLDQNYPGNELTFEMLEKAESDLGIKINLYKGMDIYYSSFGKYFTTGILSPYMSYPPYNSIFKNSGKNFLSNEEIENLKYRAYYHMLNRNGAVIEINDAFNKVLLPISVDEFDTILFGSYAVASIMIILLSTLLSNQISKPINKLTRATQAISGGDLDVVVKNEYSGEIAQLINGFNSMTRQLKKNNTELANLEREIAWKEMAKQVAHEIKNPLTPMKLSVQHLKAAYEDRSEKFDEIFRRVTGTLINQIETLRRIATEFGNIAKMPKVNLEKLNLLYVVNQATDLFVEEEVEIIVKNNKEPVYIYADFDHLKRSFINLIRNAIQAGADKIIFDIQTEEFAVLLRIIDNGKGIPDEIKDKIFDINFTTKPEGMGIGLTIARRFLENIHATLSLEKTDKNGTVFLIKFNKREE